MNKATVLTAGLTLALLTGCQESHQPISVSAVNSTPATPVAGAPGNLTLPPVPAGFQLVNDPKEIEAMAQAIQPGAAPPPGYVGFVGLRGEEAMAVALTPKNWVTANPPAQPNSADVAIYMLSMSARQARYKDALENTLRDQVGIRSGLGPVHTVALQAIVVKVGTVDVPAHVMLAESRFGNKATEYEVTVPYKGQTVRIVWSGLPGFGGYFPIPAFGKFLKQLPSPPPVGAGGKPMQ